MRKIEIRIRQIIWALKETFKPTTYDLIKYKNKEYIIKSSFVGHNIWDLFEKNAKEPTYKYINGSDIKIILSYKRFLNVFKNRLLFQKQNWQIIDLNNPIGVRLSYNNSDDIIYYNV